MKNKFIVLLLSLIFISILSMLIISNYRKAVANREEFNKEYLSLYNKEILGTELISTINKTSDNNEKNGVEKDEDNVYIENETKSVKIYIKFLDSPDTFQMEAISNGGIENFVKYYAGYKFKCTNIEYHKNGNVKSIYFEQT